jgi:hypothetical protein
MSLQPLEIQKNWHTIALRGQFEPTKALSTCRDWARELSKPTFRAKTFAQVFDGSTPALATLGKYQSEALAIGILCKLIGDTCDFFNVGGNMTDIQIQQTAIMIIDSYHWFNIYDFTLCFKNAKVGKYGKLYDRLDGAVILQWLEAYNQERLGAAQLHTQQENRKQKEASKQMHPKVAAIFKQFGKAEQFKNPMSQEELAQKKQADIETIKMLYPGE